MTTPDDIISDRITNALLEKKLVTESDAKALTAKLARGQIKENDWLTMFRAAAQEQSVPAAKDDTIV